MSELNQYIEKISEAKNSEEGKLFHYFDEAVNYLKQNEVDSEELESFHQEISPILRTIEDIAFRSEHFEDYLEQPLVMSDLWEAVDTSKEYLDYRGEKTPHLEEFKIQIAKLRGNKVYKKGLTYFSEDKMAEAAELLQKADRMHEEVDETISFVDSEEFDVEEFITEIERKALDQYNSSHNASTKKVFIDDLEKISESVGIYTEVLDQIKEYTDAVAEAEASQSSEHYPEVLKQALDFTDKQENNERLEKRYNDTLQEIKIDLEKLRESKETLEELDAEAPDFIDQEINQLEKQLERSREVR